MPYWCEARYRMFSGPSRLRRSAISCSILIYSYLRRPHLSSFGTKWCPVAWFYLTITVGLDTTHSGRPMTHLLNQKAPRFSICRPGKACWSSRKPVSGSLERNSSPPCHASGTLARPRARWRAGDGQGLNVIFVSRLVCQRYPHGEDPKFVRNTRARLRGRLLLDD